MNQLMTKINPRNLIGLLYKNDLVVFTDNRKRYNLNIVNIRSSENKSGNFDDVQVVFWFYNKKFEYKVFPVTTDPGVPYLLKPINWKGTAIVAPGQYRQVWRLGKHKGKYLALVQNNYIEVFRDNNRNEIIDSLSLEELNSNPRLGFNLDEGFFGINCHRASKYGLAERVGYYSAGCVVHQDPKLYDVFIKICEEAAKNYGNSFTATWITERDYDLYTK